MEKPQADTKPKAVRKLPDYSGEPLIPKKAENGAPAETPVEAAPAEPPVIDPALGQDDIRITITVKINGQKVNILEHKFETLVPDGAKSARRQVLHLMLAQLYESIKLAIASRVNEFLGFDAFKENGKAKKSSKFSKEALPDFVDVESMTQPQPPFQVHTDPELDLPADTTN